MPFNLIYLHGFLSSPQSVKARQTLDFVTQHYPQLDITVPELSPYPDEVEQQLVALAQQKSDKPLRFIGSSMGGFLSTFLVERFGGKAVLINPAVRPYVLLKDYLGEHQNPYTGRRFTLVEAHMDMLRALDCPTLKQPDHYWTLLQTGDETLDYREAEQKYQGGKLTIEQGGDHSFQHFERYLPDILAFLLR